MGSGHSKQKKRRGEKLKTVEVPLSCRVSESLISQDGRLEGTQDAKISLTMLGGEKQCIAVTLGVTTIAHLKRVMQAQDGVHVWRRTIFSDQTELEDHKTLLQCRLGSDAELMSAIRRVSHV
jgi:hypothetical protein